VPHSPPEDIWAERNGTRKREWSQAGLILSLLRG
jgi:hypothetical protein